MAESWQQVTPLATEDPAPGKRKADVVALVAGIVFSVIAVLGLVDLDLDLGVLEGGLIWVVLIGAGVALLVNELRRARRRSAD